MLAWRVVGTGPATQQLAPEWFYGYKILKKLFIELSFPNASCILPMPKAGSASGSGDQAGTVRAPGLSRRQEAKTIAIYTAPSIEQSCRVQAVQRRRCGPCARFCSAWQGGSMGPRVDASGPLPRRAG
jgi:hypothetical protein